MEGAHLAESGDLPACARLLSEATLAVGGQRGGRLLVDVRSPDAPPVSADGAPNGALASWASDPAHVLVAGTVDTVVTGVGAGHVQQVAGGRLGVVDCLYVEPAARGVGVGSALTAALLVALRELGCTAVDALALPGDRETKQRWEAAGFSARLLVLHRRLP